MKAAKSDFQHQNSTNQSSPFFKGSGTGFFGAEKQNNSFFGPATIQPKLTIGQPNDKYEQEADSMADRVISMESTINNRQANNAPFVQTKCAACDAEEMLQTKIDIQKQEELEEESLQTKPDIQKQEELEEEPLQTKPILMKSSNGNGIASPGLTAKLNQSRGGGSPLSDSSSSFMSSAFGTNFSNVRIHTGSEAVQMNKELRARAFTHGADIYFNKGQYNPGTPEGKHLLAHELTHIIQQQNNDKVGTIQNLPQESKVIQAYSLNGFPKIKTGRKKVSKEQRMKDAIASAVTIVANCKKVGDVEGFLIIRAIRGKRYDYVPDLDACGWTFPASWYIKIGESAFDETPDKCCYLSSTIAHEAAHTVFKAESRADKLECDCFGCSC